jgi:hypothetical protein
LGAIIIQIRLRSLQVGHVAPITDMQ